MKLRKDLAKELTAAQLDAMTTEALDEALAHLDDIFAHQQLTARRGPGFWAAYDNHVKITQELAIRS